MEENGDNSNTGDRISRVQRGFDKDGNITSSGQSEKGHSRLQGDVAYTGPVSQEIIEINRDFNVNGYGSSTGPIALSTATN